MALAAPQNAPSINAFSGVSARTMRANLRFLASDEMRGRDTPSSELDLAAAWIASQFEQAGLEPGVKDSYFQVATFRDKSVRNVIGILPGSDPVLKNSYLLVSGHYDHVGVRGTEGDTIFNGANDNGSSIVAMIELAKCFANMKVRPKRTLVFMAFWGEEKGLQGAFYYGKNPVFPLANTVAMVNMEQLGRTDDTDGPQISRFAITGFDYTNLPATMSEAGRLAGVAVDKRPQGDPYFMASDNAALAAVGVPAHTVSVSYAFPDYHRATDHWDKIDYENMMKVTKAIGLGVFMLAEAKTTPKWNESNPKTKRYVEAWKKLQGG
ncbi:MAG: M28 family peptidase [Fimbriimonadaceae bacterium]|nr:M28 family peptidase [Fimbriimonadaceae bacterium]